MGLFYHNNEVLIQKILKFANSLVKYKYCVPDLKTFLYCSFKT